MPDLLLKEQVTRPVRFAALFLGPLFIYLTISVLYFGKYLNWRRWYFGGGNDPVTFVWFLNWWPFALTHGLNPFVTKYVWFPQGYNLTWATSVPFASLVMSPVTLLLGPVLSFNLLSVSAPVFAAWTAFLLTRELTGDWMAALIGGYVFGFSSYEFGQLLGHLNLDLICLVPLAVLLCVQRVTGRLPRKNFIAYFVFVLLAQLGLSIEILATSCALGGLSWIICLLLAPAHERRILLHMAVDIVYAGFIAMVLAVPFLVFLFKGLADLPDGIFSPSFYSADLLNYIMPTNVTRFGSRIFAPVSAQFTANNSEQGAYLGLPLIFLAAFALQGQLFKPYGKALLITTCLIVLLSLGPSLHINGVNTKIWLPWSLVTYLPFIHNALPIRLTMYASLCTGIIISLWLAKIKTGLWRPVRFVMAVLACLFLMPNTKMLAWASWPAQAFYTAQNILQNLGGNSNVIILPFASSGPGMAWQLEAGLAFTQSGGYAGFTPKQENAWAILNELYTGTVGPDFATDLAVYCKTHKVDFLLVGPKTPLTLVNAIWALHWPLRVSDGVTIIQVPDLSALKYRYVLGDYWPTPPSFSWAGKQMQIVTHDFPTMVTVYGRERPIQAPVKITVTNRFGQSFYLVNQSSITTFLLPPDATTTLVAARTFVPDKIIHNGDLRQLSVALLLGTPH